MYSSPSNNVPATGFVKKTVNKQTISHAMKFQLKRHLLIATVGDNPTSKHYNHFDSTRRALIGCPVKTNRAHGASLNSSVGKANIPTMVPFKMIIIIITYEWNSILSLTLRILYHLHAMNVKKLNFIFYNLTQFKVVYRTLSHSARGTH